MNGEKKEIHLEEKIRFEGKELRISLRPDADESVLAEIFRWREYRAAEAIIRSLTLPVLDAGAHIGLFSLYAAALNPQVRIYALEPEKDNFALLLANLRQNGPHEIKAVKAALAGTTEQRRLLLAFDSINHRLLGAEEEAEKEELVRALSLRDFLTDYRLPALGLLKMDIEGGEYEVLENLGAEDFPRLRNIILEYHEQNGRRGRELEALLRQEGFGVEAFPSRFEKGLGFLLARNKRSF